MNLLTQRDDNSVNSVNSINNPTIFIKYRDEGGWRRGEGGVGRAGGGLHEKERLININQKVREREREREKRSKV